MPAGGAVDAAIVATGFVLLMCGFFAVSGPTEKPAHR
jgi:hypothetical protein